MNTIPTALRHYTADGVTSQHLASMLGMPHKDVMSAANTLKRKTKKFSPLEYTAVHPVNGTRFVAYGMSFPDAIMLVSRLDVDKLPDMLRRLTAVQGDALAANVATTCVVFDTTALAFDYRDVMEMLPRRSASSVKRSINTQAKRLLEQHPELCHQIKWVDNPVISGATLSSRWMFTHAMLVCGFHFAGVDASEYAVYDLTPSGDVHKLASLIQCNPQLEVVPLDPILRLVK